MRKYLTPALPARCFFIVLGVVLLAATAALEVLNALVDASGAGLRAAAESLNDRDGI